LVPSPAEETADFLVLSEAVLVLVIVLENPRKSSTDDYEYEQAHEHEAIDKIDGLRSGGGNSFYSAASVFFPSIERK
jgi:hypothetical protein